jgi:hypothetical protein
MINSRVANVRKVQNDMIVVDPSMINMEDLSNPEPGKLIRLKREVWGRGVRDAVEQLKVQDTTASHVKDASMLMDMMQKISAATDATMGIVRSGGERRTATEYQQTVGNAISRLRHLAMITGVMAMRNIGYMCAVHTQQLMSQSTYMRLLGDWPDALQKEFRGSKGVNINPSDLMVPFDVATKDGSTPRDTGMSAHTWAQIFQIIAGNPTLMQTFDVTRIFTHWARMSGAKNIHEFMLTDGVGAAKLASDQQALEGAQKGNLVPADQAGEIPQLQGMMGGVS